MCIGLRRCAAITSVSFLLSLAAAAHGQDVARVKEKQPIPRGGYKSWSLFLVSRQSWLVTPNKELVADLYDRFEAFGRQIGDDHLAVWFWKDEPAPNDPRLKIADNVDVARASAFCAKLKLKPNSGPYLIFTTTYPDENTAPSAFSVIELGSTADQIGRLLERLGDQLVTDGVIKNREFVHATGTDDFWNAWYDATRHALSGLGFAFPVSVSTPTLSLESGARR